MIIPFIYINTPLNELPYEKMKAADGKQQILQI